MPNENYRQDVDGYEDVTSALMVTVNSYPGLDGNEFKFTTLDPDFGLSIMASSGSFILEDHESITGHVWQTCLYPFIVIYRVAGLNEARKIEVKEWMDTFARWLTRQPVKINGSMVVLGEWPKLTEGRYIKDIIRQTSAYLGVTNEDRSETWVMNLQIHYWNEFDR